MPETFEWHRNHIVYEKPVRRSAFLHERTFCVHGPFIYRIRDERMIEMVVVTTRRHNTMRYAVKTLATMMMLFIFFLARPLAALAAIDLENLDIGKLPEWRMATSSLGGKLLLSDSPEMVADDGILYQDKVEGNVRLFFYHVNAAGTAKQMEVILENAGPEIAHVTVQQYGLGGPGYSWISVGKEAVTSYLTGSPSYQLAIPAGGRLPLSSGISATAVLPNMLINGIFDFKADYPVTVKVMMMPMYTDGAEFSQRAKILPHDNGHLRGTFDGANRQMLSSRIYDPSRDGAVALTLADDAFDHYLEGIDATDGTKVVDYGNYGVLYQIFLPSKNSGKIGYYLAPLGGDYAGAVRIKYRQMDEGPVGTPPDRTAFGGTGAADFSLIGIFDSNQSLSFTFSPPGASNLPVRLIILPQ